jgi:hypothetical protein
MAREPAPDLIYEPAKRGGVGLLIMFAGPSGSGKTLSALRLATGLAQGGTIGFCDTEHGRALYYADDFEFKHHRLQEPFNPAKFEAAAVSSQRAGHRVWICDSFSHEHVGPGGVLDMFENELRRLVPDDNFQRRDQMKMVAWIEPKGQHKHLLQRLWQLNEHIILCVHAERKIEMVKNSKGKMEPVDRGYQPVCSPDIPYAMTASFMFSAERPGVPIWIKRFGKIEPLIDVNNPIDEATGERLAQWALGKDARSRAPAAPRKAAAPAAAAPPPAETPGEPPPTEEPPPAEPPPEDQPSDLGGAIPPPRENQGKGRTEAIVNDLIARFNAVQVRADHFAIVDDKTQRDRIAWVKKHRKTDLAPALTKAMQASWDRTAVKQEATS